MEVLMLLGFLVFALVVVRWNEKLGSSICPCGWCEIDGMGITREECTLDCRAYREWVAERKGN